MLLSYPEEMVNSGAATDKLLMLISGIAFTHYSEFPKKL